MSDQYTPPNPPGYAGEKPRYTGRSELPPRPVVQETSAGFGTGMLVALVFVVLAILAVAVFGYNSTNLQPASNAPAVSIQNNAAPASGATADPAPANPAAPAPADTIAPSVADPAAPAPDTGATAPKPDTVAPAPPAPANP